MRRTALAAALLAAAASLSVAPAASACASPRCEQMNEICYAALRTYCLR